MRAGDGVMIRKTCRLCSSERLDLALKLNPTALCDAYLLERKEQETYPLNLCLCAACGFVQIDCVIDPEKIYRDYIFVTTSSSPLTSHFSQYAEDALSRTKLEKNVSVIDIGSNDGTLLRAFKAKGCSVQGVEPAIEIAQQASASGIPTIPEFFTPSVAKQIVDSSGQTDIVTVNNLFANVDDLDEFVRSVNVVLREGGFLIVESSYLKDMLENMVFDFIYHEHLSYFSIRPLIKFFRKHQMTLVDAVSVETKGGSLRYFIQKTENQPEVTDGLQALIEVERAAALDQLATYRRFSERIESAKTALHDFLKHQTKESVVGYGASATSTTLIGMFELQDYLGCLVDDFDAKQGTFSPGNHIPVKAPSILEHEEIKVVVILAWRYAEEIMKKHAYFQGLFVIPLPELKIVSVDG